MIGGNETNGAILGGTCINVGCVPSKRLITVARFVKELGEKGSAALNTSWAG